MTKTELKRKLREAQVEKNKQKVKTGCGGCRKKRVKK